MKNLRYVRWIVRFRPSNAGRAEIPPPRCRMVFGCRVYFTLRGPICYNCKNGEGLVRRDDCGNRRLCADTCRVRAVG